MEESKEEIFKNNRLYMNKDYLNKLIDTALSPEQLQKIMVKATGQKTKMIFLDKVKETDTVDSLFDAKNQDSIIYSPVSSKWNGHFQAMYRDKQTKTIYWMDSYGHTPAYLFQLVEQEYGRKDNPNLYKILNQSGYKLIMNTYEYQGEELQCDCGRYSTSLLILKRRYGPNFNFDTYFKLLTEFMKKNKLNSYDEAVTVFTQKFLE